MAMPSFQAPASNMQFIPCATPGTGHIKTLTTASQQSNVFDASNGTVVNVFCVAACCVKVGASPTADRTTSLPVPAGIGKDIHVPPNQKIAVISLDGVYAGTDSVFFTPWG